MQETLAEMEELENNDAEVEVDADSTADGKLSLRNFETGEGDTVTSEYAALYKATKIPASQEKRRKKLLDDMKSRRNEVVNQKRGLLELLNNDSNDLDELEIEQKEQEEPMEVVTKHKRRRRRKKKNIFTNRLMFSEWFTEIPFDLESQWLVKLCPVGVRNLVVAHRGVSKAFGKSGVLHSKFQSALPGGNNYHVNSREFTILDCIYCSKLKCYFILDVIAWRNFDLQNSEAEFRFFWLKSKLDETPELKEVTTLNERAFYEIDNIPAELPLIQDKLSRPYKINDQVILLDGILFYHRATHYISSQTPLVGWLKPFMVPEMLHLPVDECFMQKMPNNYKSMQHYLNTSPKILKNKSYDNNETLTEVEMEM